MILTKVKLVFTFVAAFCLGTTAKEHCHKLLGILANTQSLFLECLTLNGAPVTVCMNCTMDYGDMVTSFNNLTANKTCYKKYFDNDRINVVSTTQSILAGLWKKAFCESCSSTDTAKFQEKDEVFQTCLKNNGTENKDACRNCLNQYTDLNDYYKQMNIHNGEVCFDLQDRMNRSRSKWSKELKCCKREYDLFTFIVTSSVITSLPVFFYVALFVYTKKTERNHEMLISDRDVISVAQEQPSTSHSNIIESNKPKLNDNKTTMNNNDFYRNITEDHDESLLKGSVPPDATMQ